MTLAQLVINCIKETIRTDDSALTVDSLVDGTLGENPDYSIEVNNVLLSINKAISRLMTAKKIPLKTDVLTADSDTCIYDISSITDLRKIVAIFVMKNGIPYNIGWRFVTPTTIYLGYGLEDTINIQYERYIPNFVWDDVEDTDTDLKEEYGLDDELCNYINYFAKSELMEDIDPDRCKRYLNYFEQFINELDRRESAMHQNSINAKYRW